MIAIHSYKNYLEILKEKRKPRRLKKTFIISLLFVLISLGISSSLLFVVYQKEMPKIIKNQYLDLTATGFTKVSASLDENLASFQVAGAKVKFIDSYKESSKSAQGYFVTISDLEKNLSTIHSSQALILTESNDLKNIKTPQAFEGLNKDLLGYYQSASQNLDGVEKDYSFTRDIMLILGSDFYTPQLTKDELWKEKNNDDVKKYYEKTKNEAEETINKLETITPPQNFKEYQQTQLKYLALVKNVSDNILKILEGRDETNPDNATQLEKAYQLLIGAKRENEEISKNLLGQRLKLFSLKDNLEKFAATKILENSIKQKFDEAQNITPEQKLSLTGFIDFATQKITGFLEGTI